MKSPGCTLDSGALSGPCGAIPVTALGRQALRAEEGNEAEMQSFAQICANPRPTHSAPVDGGCSKPVVHSNWRLCGLWAVPRENRPSRRLHQARLFRAGLAVLHVWCQRPVLVPPPSPGTLTTSLRKVWRGQEKPPSRAGPRTRRAASGAWTPPDLSSPMFLTVKLLLGRRCSVKVTGQESVAALKKLVSTRLQVPEEQQHLLFRGQILADDKLLSDYSIGPNAAINVIMRPPEASAPPQARRPQPLWQRLDQVLAKHFSPQDADALLRLLRQEHEARLQRIGLGDLEQLAQYLLAQELPAEPAGDKEAEPAEPPEKGETDQ
ncbi:Ubiquitin-like protein 4B [Galemys pyrenaicus]|uniref:Ubiquitin-like protein 4B n=1 Tax=Galemys pyrenaicus TaxID=202257 RepID=A0A8J6AAU7_GALPY|nr:Ubiquitin-like protein 4B [Galemys pyrenaicus]